MMESHALVDRKCASIAVVALVVATVSLITACERTNAREATNLVSTTNPQTSHFSTICLDRLLIDLPETVEVGAVGTEYDDAYGLQGIDDVGTKGIRWANISITESFATGVDGFQSVRSGARRALTSAVAGYKTGMKEGPDEVKHWEQLVDRDSTDETARKVLEQKRRALQQVISGAKVSGEAKLKEPLSFGFRRNLDFSVGYFDHTDHRVRMFEGPLTSPGVESPQAAADQLAQLQRIYRRRDAMEVPTTPGYCTAHGFIDEQSRPEAHTALDIPFRSLKYPNLIFFLTVRPALADARNIQKLKNMGIFEGSQISLVDAKDVHGPTAIVFMGSPGRLLEVAHTPSCYRSDCRPASVAFEMEATTFGESGRFDRPAVTLVMKALVADDTKVGDSNLAKRRRAALAGHEAPSFEEGRVVFEQAVRSLRPRPGAVAGSLVLTPPRKASAQ